MDNARFLSILNRALRDSGIDLSAAVSPSDAGLVAAWADLLRRCTAAGVSIADPRWRDLEVRLVGGTPKLVLAGKGGADASDEESDFTLGLSLLMSMLGRSPDKNS